MDLNMQSTSEPSAAMTSAPTTLTPSYTDAITTVHRHCPSCGKNGTPHRKIVSSKPPAENADFAEVSHSWQQFFKEKVFFTYVSCGSCGLLFCPTYFSQKSIQTMYSHMTDNTASVAVAILMKTTEWYKNFLKAHSKLHGTSAEFGPDIGLLAGLCARDGLYDKYLFLEPNLEVHRQLAAAVAPKEAVTYADLDAYKSFKDGEVSHVNMIHVLDHMLEPLALLKILKMKLVPGGTLMAVVHNQESLLAKLFGKAWPPFCLQHPQLFNPKTLAALLERGGFKVKIIRKSINVFPVNYLLNHLFYAMGLKKLRAPKWLSISVPLFLGNIVVVAEV